MAGSTTSFSSDALRDRIYLSVGRALEQWSIVEQNLASLLETMIGHRRYHLIGAAFHAVVNFNSKLAMVDEVAKRTLTGARLTRWNALYNKLGRKARKRNEIAHFSIVFHGRAPGTFEARLHPYWSLAKPTPRNEGL